jgi:carbon-monoxide dehydrogenase medium subunit
MAGGTDILLQTARQAAVPVLIDISGIPELGAIEVREGGLQIGAAVRLIDLARSPLLGGAWSALAQGAAEVGSPQIRNLATLGGNLCNASPSADTAAPLLALEARLELASPDQQRQLALDEFFLGPGKTALAPNEILTHIFLPVPPPTAAGCYIKLKVRQAMDLAIVGVSAVLASHEGGRHARLALSAVAPTPIRVPAAEQLLAQAERLDQDVIDAAARLAMERARPISDVRASARYRLEMVRTLSRQALCTLWDDLQRQA